jgi:hypothetical protein
MAARRRAAAQNRAAYSSSARNSLHLQINNSISNMAKHR